MAVVVVIPAVTARVVVLFVAPIVGALVPINAVRATHVRHIACCAEVWANIVEVGQLCDLRRATARVLLPVEFSATAPIITAIFSAEGYPGGRDDAIDVDAMVAAILYQPANKHPLLLVVYSRIQRKEAPAYIPIGFQGPEDEARCSFCITNHLNPNCFGWFINRFDCNICAREDVLEYFIPCGHTLCLIYLVNFGLDLVEQYWSVYEYVSSSYVTGNRKSTLMREWSS